MIVEGQCDTLLVLWLGGELMMSTIGHLWLPLSRRLLTGLKLLVCERLAAGSQAELVQEMKLGGLLCERLQEVTQGRFRRWN